MKNDSAHRSTTFYVGHRPLPSTYKQTLVVLAPSLLAALLVIAAALAASQRDPGAAVRGATKMRTWSGVAFADPYPMLLEDERSDPILLVESGKRGAQSHIAPYVGLRVVVTGSALERAGQRMIELTPGAKAIAPLSPAVNAAHAPTSAGANVTFAGEILDTKCFLGAMKPGDGKTHKACATLCIAGGIPPALFVSGINGEVYMVLLTDENGGIARNIVLPFVGEPVVVHGALHHVNGAATLSIGPDSVKRAGAGGRRSHR